MSDKIPVQKYKVEKDFARYEAGDIVFFNHRQAEHLLAAGLISPVANDAKKQKTEQQ